MNDEEKVKLCSEYNILVNEILNGNLFTRSSLLMYPLIAGIKYNDHINTIIGNLCDYSGVRRPDNNNDSFLGFLVKIWELIKTIDVTGVSSERLEINAMSNAKTHTDGQKEIVEYIRKQGKSELILFYGIHGSYADGEIASNISDLDLVVILRDKAFDSIMNLKKVQRIIFGVRKKLCRIDIFQHHGTFVLSEGYFNKYINSFFPTVIFKETKYIINRYNEQVLVIQANNNSIKKSLLASTTSYLRDTNIYKLNMYEFKVYFQVIQLIPVMYLQYKNNYIIKRDSFEEFARYFRSFEALNSDLLEMRRDWKQPSASKYFAFVHHLIAKKFAKPNRTLVKQLDDILTRNKFEEMLVEIEHEYGNA